MLSIKIVCSCNIVKVVFSSRVLVFSPMNRLQRQVMDRTAAVNERVTKERDLITQQPQQQPLQRASSTWSQDDLNHFHSLVSQSHHQRPQLNWEEIGIKINKDPKDCEDEYHRLLTLSASTPGQSSSVSMPQQHTIGFFFNPAIHHSSVDNEDWFLWFATRGFQPEWWNFSTTGDLSSYPSPMAGEAHDISFTITIDGSKKQIMAVLEWICKVALRNADLESFFSPPLQAGVIFYLTDPQISALKPLLLQAQCTNPTSGIYREDTIRNIPSVRLNSKFDALETTTHNKQKSIGEIKDKMAARATLTHQVYVLDENLEIFAGLMERAYRNINEKGKINN